MIRHSLPREILKIVCRQWRVSKQIVLSSSRSPYVCEARRVACYLMADVYKLKALDAADLVHRDYSTVLEGIREVRSRVAHGADEKFIAKIGRTKNTIDQTMARHLENARLRDEQPKAPRAFVPKKPKIIALPAPDRSPALNPDEARRLRRMGWSQNGLVRRYGMPWRAIAAVIGEVYGDNFGV
jgi:hypothetical protein